MIPYHIASFLGGKSDYDDKGILGSFKYGVGLDIRKQKDTLTCQQALIDDLAPGTFNDLAVFTVPADDGNTYFFLRSGRVYRRDFSGNYLLVYTESSDGGQIKGAAQWYDNAGFTYLFWATATTLHVKKIIGSAYTNVEPWNDVDTASTGTWPKTNLTSSDWHTMKQSNGSLQICNGQYIAFVGFDLSYSNQILRLIPGNIARTLVERGIYTIFGTNRTNSVEEMSLYAWDGTAQDYNNKQIFKVNGINSMIDTEIALMQVGSLGQLYISDLSNPLPLTSFSGSGQTYPDGVDSDRGMAMFGVFGHSSGYNGIWTYGRIRKNAPIVLNYEYALDCDEIGSIKKINGIIYVTYRKGTTYGVKKVDSNTKANAEYLGLDLIVPMGTRRYPIPGRELNWGYAHIAHAPLPEGTGIEFWYRNDKAGDLIQASLQEQPTVTRQTATGEQNTYFALGEKGRIFEPDLKLFPFGNLTPEVYEFNIYFNVMGG